MLLTGLDHKINPIMLLTSVSITKSNPIMLLTSV